MSVTLKQIARHCNLDISTISKALRGNPMINEQTRQRVLQVARDMGYAPNPAARSLVGARSQTVWFILGTTEDIVYVPAAEAASIALMTRSYDLLMVMHHGDEHVYKRLAARLLQGMADGAIVAPRHQDQDARSRTELALKPIYDRGMPMVFLDQNVPGWHVPVVTTDNRACTRQLVGKCLDRGAGEFYLLFSEANNAESDRTASARRSLEEAGVVCHAMPDAAQAAPRPADPARPIAVLASAQATITEFMTANPALFAATPLIIGCFDQWHGVANPASHIFLVKQDLPALATAAIDILLDMIEKRLSPAQATPLVELPAANIIEILSC